MTTALLVRHGQSTANAGRPSTRPASIPLSELGKRQAAVVAGAFAEAPDLIVTSPFTRARDTAIPTTERFPAVPVEVWPVEEFSYLNSLQTRPTTQDERRPRVEAYWAAADPLAADGESFAGVWERARMFLRGLAERDGRVITFTHGMFTRVVLWQIFTGAADPTADAMRRFAYFIPTYRIPNCSIITLCRSAGREWWVAGGTVTHLPPDLRSGGRD